MEKKESCLYCGSQTLTLLMRTSDFMVSGEVFTVVKCLSCSFSFTNPRPSPQNIGRYYKSDDYISHNDQSKGFMSKIYQLVRNHMLIKKNKLIKSSFSGEKHIHLLDYGCATGEFLLRAQKFGFSAYGYEPDENALARAKQKKLKVTNDINRLASQSKNKRFNVITLWHVLEHIPDLNVKISKFHELLSDNGLIVVAVPEYRSYDASFYGKYWAAWDLPRHLNHFDNSSLINWFNDNGFDLEKIIPLWFDAFYISMLSEKYKKTGLTGLIRGFIIGTWSNIVARFTARPSSSQIYFFRRRSHEG